ncbi:MAG TPA: hypothetical protein VK517_13515 [Cyclobacteriaceae bacterium]|jgi:hypothetical protein|nr:hypothetical protein [Cyclobacteriaceae bacterium]
MNPEIVLYKEQFNATLDPIKAMLIDKKNRLSYEDWRAFVDRTESSILRNPDQYLGSELPEQESLNFIVNGIFREFLDILSNQS